MTTPNRLNKVELQYLYTLSQELDNHDKAIEWLQDKESKVSVTKSYNSHEITGADDVTGEIKRAIVDVLIERRAEVRKKLEDAGVKL